MLFWLNRGEARGKAGQAAPLYCLRPGGFLRRRLFCHYRDPFSFFYDRSGGDSPRLCRFAIFYLQAMGRCFRSLDGLYIRQDQKPLWPKTHLFSNLYGSDRYFFCPAVDSGELAGAGLSFLVVPVCVYGFFHLLHHLDGALYSPQRRDVSGL